MSMSNLLLTTILLPLAGSLAICAVGRDARAARATALVVSLATLIVTAILLCNYVPGDDSFAAWSYAWLGETSAVDIRFDVALDGISLWLFGLSSLLLLACVLLSWDAVTDRPGTYYALLLLLGSGMLGVFAARDIILFYVFFEFTLIPLFLLIGMWGHEDRQYAATKFFIYTLAGSMLTFLALLSIVLWDYYHSPDGVMTFSIPQLTAGLAARPIAEPYQLWIFLGLFAGFAIKVPLFPLHTWLPLAHTQAPSAGSVLLAGILLKIGTYGFLRFSIPMLPDATVTCMPWMLALAVAGILYGALAALAQSDMKRLIAYSSVSHLGFVMLGLFALTSVGMEGGVLQMINHGLSTGGLFAVVGMVYERYHTRQISELGGLARQVPWLAFFFLVFTLSSIGLPGLNGFAGEFLILIGMFQRAFVFEASTPAVAYAYKAIAVLAVFGVVLGAWYMLWLVQRVFFGPPLESDHEHAAQPPRDVTPVEAAALVPLCVFVLWIGVHPEFFLSRMRPALQPVAQAAIAALAERERAQPPVAANAPAAAVVELPPGVLSLVE
ncbi:MAG: NADH-quinone oxidoreductase subunit M [Pirellulales bacterium]